MDILGIYLYDTFCRCVGTSAIFFHRVVPRIASLFNEEFDMLERANP